MHIESKRTEIQEEATGRTTHLVDQLARIGSRRGMPNGRPGEELEVWRLRPGPLSNPEGYGHKRVNTPSPMLESVCSPPNLPSSW